MTRYEQGFMRKCAERGVDGRALFKRAFRYAKVDNFENLIMRFLRAKPDRLEAFAHGKPDLYRNIVGAVRRANELKLPENHPAWKGINESWRQFRDEDHSHMIDKMLSEDASRRFAALLARSHQKMGTLFLG